ncbi:MAG: GreA/GreB family elongation factor [Candidatus Methylumidiphilus sp.]
MSRAFVKEADGDDVLEALPERPVSPHLNLVTPQGLLWLREQVRDLQALRNALADSEDLADRQRLHSLDRELRYFDSRASTAVLVDPASQLDHHVHFGSTVEVVDQGGEVSSFAIVGEDEADVAAGKISWVSPLARALLDAEVDDQVLWRRPAGDKTLTVLSIRKGTS